MAWMTPPSRPRAFTPPYAAAAMHIVCWAGGILDVLELLSSPVTLLCLAKVVDPGPGGKIGGRGSGEATVLELARHTLATNSTDG